MPLPFGNPEPHALKQTFLKDVTIVVRYDSVCDVCQSDELTKFANDRFNLDIFKDWQGQEEVVMSSDNLVKFSFLENEVKIRLRFPNYKRFDDILKFLPLALEFLSLRKADCVTEIAVVKYNEINYTLPNERLSAKDAMKDLFNDELLKDDDIFDMSDDDFKNLSRWEKKLDFSDDENHNLEVFIVCGFAINPETPNRGALILKPSVSYKCKDMPLVNLHDELKRLNTIAFQAFHWSIRQEIFSKLLE